MPAMQPFKDAETANAAIEAFCDGVAKLRLQHNIRNVAVGVMVDAMYGDELGCAQTYQTWGDHHRDVALVAYMLGSLEADSRAVINQIRAGFKTAGNRKPITQ